ncbi:cobyrinate a,c-diamide synthase [Pendulispora rubella]|uniref:Cobyrinate a,c-diamide synthase n=1 Tax=Pendulispora rubella TaxID=2741070 RepID=A0ABZ2L4Z1_9BACT
MSDLAFPRLVIAGTSSGVGKTTVTVALARALRARGLRVALFKCGPDYLDPTYHARAIDAPSQNLDGWMMGHDAVRATFAHAARDADISLIEGVMGLYDGASPTGEEGSTAEIAKWLDAPVVLVVDAGGMARSIAALVGGYASFDPKLHVAAAVANRVGSRGHLDLLRRALRTPPILGGFPRDPEHAFAERHLGLRTADDSSLPSSLLDHWAEQASEWFSLDALLALATSAPSLTIESEIRGGGAARVGASAGPRIAIARDAAFHFYYADNLRRLESLGAELVPFSPVSETALPDADGVYLGGGYPEVHAAALSANAAMRGAIAAFAQAGGPIYAECGGLMYLTQAIVTTDGHRHPMVGLVPTEARMCGKLQALGYVEVETQTKTILGGAGSRFRGHQFRYSELDPEPPPSIERVYSLRRRRGDETTREGFRIGNVVASYVHAHWASNPRIAASFVESCASHRKARTP